jgi:diguanylate cyclase (GGDEF)-like protein
MSDERDREDSTLVDLSATKARRRDDGQKYTPVLVVVDGPRRGQRYPITQRETIIGRGTKADICIYDELASRSHARIIYYNYDKPGERPRCEVEDLKSRNGTEVNGRTVSGLVALHERDRILIGSTLFGFFLRDEGEFQLERTLYEMAAHDALTGLANRHQFTALLAHHVERARRYQRPLALMMVDADHFKQINDQYGHDVGDAALIHLAHLIVASCRASEVVARWGGEEFAVLLTESEAAAAGVLAERIRQVVERTPLETRSATVRMSVSIGAAQLQQGENADDFFRRADLALRQAKEAGRNRVVIADIRESKD